MPRAATAPRRVARAPYTATPQTRDEMLNRIAAVQQQIDAQRSNDPTAAYQARLAQIRGMGVGGGGAGPAGGGMGGRCAAAPANLDQRRRAQQHGAVRPGRAGRPLEAGFAAKRRAHRSSCARASSCRPRLISGINSDLPGPNHGPGRAGRADTPTGKHPVDPAGIAPRRLVFERRGLRPTRVLVAWQRIVSPRWQGTDIGAMPGADSAGYAGFNDQVNNHYVRLFGRPSSCPA